MMKNLSVRLFTTAIVIFASMAALSGHVTIGLLSLFFLAAPLAYSDIGGAGEGLADDDTFPSHHTGSGFSSNDDVMAESFDHSHSINPANGLPMMGGVDIEGNPYGTDSGSLGSDLGDINPANGLPMVGGVDIEGNPFGTNSTGIDDDLHGLGSGMFDDLSSGISDDDWP